MLQRYGLSTIGGILRHRSSSPFGHVARLDRGVPAHDALRLMVDTYEGRKASSLRPPGRPRNVWLNKAQQDANALILLITLWRSEIARGDGAERRSLGLRDDDDVEGRLVSKVEGKTNFSRLLQAVLNRDC